MKKLFALLLLSTLFVACKDDKDEIENQKPLADNPIEGQWDWVDETNYKIRESRFFTDTFDSYSELEGESSSTDQKHGTYIISKNYLYYAGYTQEYKIVDNTLWLSNKEQGWSRKYVKNTDIRLEENLIKGDWRWVDPTNEETVERLYFNSDFTSYAMAGDDPNLPTQELGTYSLGEKYIHYRAGYKQAYRIEEDTLWLKDDYLKFDRKYIRVVIDGPSINYNAILASILFYGSQLNYDHAEYGVYLSQALTTGGRSQTGALAYRSGWEFLTMNRHPQWRRHYYDIGVNARELIRGAQQSKAYNLELIARTIVLMSTLYTTDAFGDMPLSEAYTSKPRYDSQEEVYEWMYSEVDDLLRMYNDASITNATSNLEVNQNVDRIYAGDLSKWRSFTYALKARIYLRNLPNLDRSASNCNIIINAVDKALSNWSEPQYKYSGGVREQNCPWGTSQAVVNSWESRRNDLDKAILSNYFAEEILGVSADGTSADDPRIFQLMGKRAGSTNDSKEKFRYLASNIGMEASQKEAHFPNLFQRDNGQATVFTSDNSYIAYMLTEELLLIKAEAQYWANNKAAAYQTTVEAAKANMKRHGVSNDLQTKYLKNPKYLPEAGFNIGHLMRQKYACMYLQAEQWTDIRRYKYSNTINGERYDGEIIYPFLRRPYNLYEPYWGGNQDWVQRINYDPETEELYNREELERLGAYRNPE